MIFFKNSLMTIFIKFFWAGLFFGLVAVVFKTISKIFKKNIVVVNLLSFVFWIAFGLIYFKMCVVLYNYSFCGFGLFGMLLGLIIIKISVDFFFDYLIRFIYNEFRNIRRKNKNGKLQTNEKVWEFC